MYQGGIGSLYLRRSEQDRKILYGSFKNMFQWHSTPFKCICTRVRAYKTSKRGKLLGVVGLWPKVLAISLQVHRF